MDKDYYKLTVIHPTTYKVVHEGTFIGWIVSGAGNTWVGYVFHNQFKPALRLQPNKDINVVSETMVDYYNDNS